MRFTRTFILLLLPGILCSSIMASGEEKANLKILTWNIQMLPTALDKFSAALQKGQKLRAPWVIEFLNQQDYDMVVLQEVIDRQDIPQNFFVICGLRGLALPEVKLRWGGGSGADVGFSGMVRE